MKSKLCSVLVILCIAMLSATAAHADEPDAVGVAETVSEPGEPADPVTSPAESELALQRVRRAQRDRQKGTGLMTAAFVAQGISFGTTFAGLLVGDTVVQFNWPVQLGTIPFAPMGVAGFALRYGGSSESERLRWTGIGLLQAAAYSGVMGALSVGSVFTQDYFWVVSIAGAISYFSASIAFVIAGGVCVGVAKAQEHRQERTQSRRTPAKSPHRGFVMPTIAPRPGGVSLGLTGVF